MSLLHSLSFIDFSNAKAKAKDEDETEAFELRETKVRSESIFCVYVLTDFGECFEDADGCYPADFFEFVCVGCSFEPGVRGGVGIGVLGERRGRGRKV